MSFNKLDLKLPQTATSLSYKQLECPVQPKLPENETIGRNLLLGPSNTLHHSVLESLSAGTSLIQSVQLLELPYSKTVCC